MKREQAKKVLTSGQIEDAIYNVDFSYTKDEYRDLVIDKLRDIVHDYLDSYGTIEHCIEIEQGAMIYNDDYWTIAREYYILPYNINSEDLDAYFFNELLSCTHLVLDALEIEEIEKR